MKDFHHPNVIQLIGNPAHHTVVNQRSKVRQRD